MWTSIALVLGVAASGSAALVGFAPLQVPAWRATARPILRMSAGDVPERHVKVELLAQHSAVGSLSRPGEKRQEVINVPPPSSESARASIMNNLRGPGVAVALIATTALTAIQAKRLYERKVEGLIADFAASMMEYLGDDAEMKSAVSTFRKKLGPGSYRLKMFTKFLVSLVNDKSLSVFAIEQLKKTISLMSLTEPMVTEALVAAAAEMEKKPAMLGKLTFLSERAVPESARKAELRSRFPKWGEDTVATLQQAMLENLYKDMCHPLEEGAPLPPGGDVLQLSEFDCARLMSETQEAKKEAIRLAEEQAKEAKKKALLEEAIRNASGVPAKGEGRPGE
mmetsp:Transcript_29354/g.94685  ORF Transcript_29354/g.94685 Transcript_29354/m.94685 type:complete len:339 (-) Transcript_29354:281-1297(-)